MSVPDGWMVPNFMRESTKTSHASVPSQALLEEELLRKMKTVFAVIAGRYRGPLDFGYKYGE